MQRVTDAVVGLLRGRLEAMGPQERAEFAAAVRGGLRQAAAAHPAPARRPTAGQHRRQGRRSGSGAAAAAGGGSVGGRGDRAPARRRVLSQGGAGSAARGGERGECRAGRRGPGLLGDETAGLGARRTSTDPPGRHEPVLRDVGAADQPRPEALRPGPAGDGGAGAQDPTGERTGHRRRGCRGRAAVAGQVAGGLRRSVLARAPEGRDQCQGGAAPRPAAAYPGGGPAVAAPGRRPGRDRGPARTLATHQTGRRLEQGGTRRPPGQPRPRPARPVGAAAAVPAGPEPPQADRDRPEQRHHGERSRAGPAHGAAGARRAPRRARHARRPGAVRRRLLPQSRRRAWLSIRAGCRSRRGVPQATGTCCWWRRHGPGRPVRAARRSRRRSPR